MLTFLVAMMWASDCFKKGDYSHELAFFNFEVPDADCPAPVEVWYKVFVVFCPAAMLAGIVLYRKARAHSNFHAYTFERRYSYYEIWTDNSREINWTVMGIEAFNIIWAITGFGINSGIPSHSRAGGSITDCMKDYGITYVLMGYCFAVFSLLHLLRLGVYLAVIMYHQPIFGYLEVRYRRNNVAAERLKEVRFKVIEYQPHHEAKVPNESQLDILGRDDQAYGLESKR